MKKKTEETAQKENSETYNQAYLQLKNGVEKLRTLETSNIDDLVPLVEKTLKAYKVCQNRLEKVSGLIKKTLEK